MSDQDGVVVRTLLREILSDAHRYIAGTDQRSPTLVASGTGPGMALRVWRERVRDGLERVALRAGFSRRHFDPAAAATRLERVLELSAGLDATYAMLGDEFSRRTLIDVLKLRVLGPFHARLRVTPEGFRSHQTYVDDALRVEAATHVVSDPWFSPLSLYRPSVEGGRTVRLHSHSVDIVSVYLLDQYTYANGSTRISAAHGDEVFDVGGCWGDTALYFAALVGGAGKVHTFEFDPESLGVMAANLELNPDLAACIDVVHNPLWNASGEMLPFVQAGRMTGLVPGARGDEGTRETVTTTLDDFRSEHEIGVDFLKLDVEGAEMRALEGGRRSLQELTPKLAVAVYHKDDDLVTIPRFLRSLGAGYTLFLKSSSPVEEETVLFAISDDAQHQELRPDEAAERTEERERPS